MVVLAQPAAVPPSRQEGLAADVDRAFMSMQEAADNLQKNDPLEAEVAIASGDLVLASPVRDLAAADALFE